MPKRRTAPIPAPAISVASATSSEIEKRSMPGIEAISSRTPPPPTTKAGWIRWAGDRSVSRTRPRRVSLRRSLRIRVLGNGIAAILGQYRSRGGGTGDRQALRRARSAAGNRLLHRARGDRRDHRAERGRQDDAALDPRRDDEARRRRGWLSRRGRRVGAGA